MKTSILKIDNLDAADLEQQLQAAVKLLQAGQVVAFPTETVYGLGANALDDRACAAIYAAKGRPADNPLIVHIEDLAMLEQLAYTKPLAYTLAAAFWPGPLTLILPKKPGLAATVSLDLPTVAIRMPAHPLAKALIKACGLPLAAPSANLSGRPSPTAAEHVYADMQGKIPLLIDGGKVDIGLESTVLDISGEQPVLLRPGQITAAQIEAVCGRQVLPPNPKLKERPPAPGMKYRHYAPQGKLYLAADIEQIIALRAELLAQYQSEPLLIICKQSQSFLNKDWPQYIIADRDDMAAYAHNLFAALRYADSHHYRAIIIEKVDERGLGIAIMNRLIKAAE